jgi:hypothetical protein
MAILATNLSRTTLLAALKARRFYSSRDKNLALSFKCNGAEMGSKVPGGTLNFQIEATDGDSETFTQVELVKNGTIINTWMPNSTHPLLTYSATGNQGDYFYAKVFQGASWTAISSPIFIVAAQSPPSAPTGLAAVGSNTLVKLAWNASTNATGYNVKRALVAGGPYTTLHSQSGTNYNDSAVTNGVWYFYVVTATNAGGESGNSAEASARPAAPPATPPTLSGYGPLSAGSFPLAFSGPSGQTYQVLSSTNVARPLANWTVLKSGTFGVGGPTSTNYTDTGATNAQQFYRIQSP